MPKVNLETGEVATLLDGLDQLLQLGTKDAWYTNHVREIKRKLTTSVPEEDRDMIDFGDED
jgi:hypothetical protein